MTASPLDFLANFQGGGFRPNRYQVILTFPAGVPNALNAATKFGFTCKAAAIPSSQMGVAEIPYMGRQIKVPGDKTWDDWNVTVMLDTDFATRDVFETWHDLILGSALTWRRTVSPIRRIRSRLLPSTHWIVTTRSSRRTRSKACGLRPSVK